MYIKLNNGQIEKYPYSDNDLKSEYNSGSTILESYTFSNVDFGPAYEGRRIIIVVGHAVVGTANGALESVTIAGASAQQLVQNQTTQTNTIQLAIYVATVSNGTSGNVILNTNNAGTDGSRLILVHSLDSPKTNYVVGSDITSTYTFGRTYANNQLYIGGGRSLSGATHTWTNATKQGELAFFGQQKISSATYFPSVAGSRTITFTPSSTSGAIMVSAVVV